ncbi:hypothetical protein BGZ83_000960 [Gryganskiella cystojenkinii]|nr:hypothetical protein BGZ83_000960 [Gryganskiella cystojenkinii]
MFSKLQNTTRPSSRSGHQKHPSPMDIPEILVQIFSLLDQMTLRRIAARVCRQWLSIAKSLIHNHLVLTGTHNSQSSWKQNFRKLLPQADQFTVMVQLEPYWNDYKLQHFYKIEKQWTRMVSLLVNDLTSKIPTFERLRDLHIDLPEKIMHVRLDWYLSTCPNLQRLPLRGIDSFYEMNAPAQYSRPQVWERPSLQIYDNDTYEWEVEDLEHTVPNTAPSSPAESAPQLFWPLRTLRLESLSMTPLALQSYLPRLGHLKRLYVPDICQLPASALLRCWDELDCFSKSKARQEFWKKLAKYCPDLNTIHFNAFHVEGNLIPVQQFPRVKSWGIDCVCLSQDQIIPTWTFLTTVHATENRLTSLEILRDQGRCEPATNGSQTTNLALYQFLCTSPLLLHFKCVISLSLVAFFGSHAVGQQEAAMFLDQSRTIPLWACRGLKSLSIRWALGDRNLKMTPPLTRKIFGYLSRVCPRLRDLEMTLTYCRFFELESGLCLLMRLRDLRRLRIFTMNGNDRISFPLTSSYDTRDMAWIRGCSDLSKVASTSATTSIITTATKWAPRNLLRQASNVFGFARAPTDTGTDDLLHCYDKVLELALVTSFDISVVGVFDPSEMRRRRTTMQDQQEGNVFKTDYDRFPYPMVDGLEGMEVCGSLLDIEACLRAQYYHHDDRNDDNSDGSVSRFHVETGVGRQQRRYGQPWPHMEQLVLACAGLNDYFHDDHRKNQKAIQEQANQTQRYLQRIRPDIPDIRCPVPKLATTYSFVDL